MANKLGAAHSIILRTGVPKGWNEVSVAELARIVGGGTPDRGEPAYWRDATIPWITPTDLTANNKKSISSGAESISVHGLANSNATLAQPGSIVFSTRGTVGNLAVASVPLTCNQSCEIVVPNSQRVSRDFLYYLLVYGHSAFNRLSGGTTFGSITRRDIARVRFAVPSDLDEQAAIAKILDAVDRALDETRAAADRAKELDHSLLHNLLEQGPTSSRRSGGRSRHPSHWSVKRVDQVAEVGSGITLGKDVSGHKSVERAIAKSW
jgi:type I restriction enzyme S subunit